MTVKVLHIVAGSLSQGAARGAYWLHLGLLSLSVGSRMVVQHKSDVREDAIEVISPEPLSKVIGFFRRGADRLLPRAFNNPKGLAFSTGIFGFDIRTIKCYRWADVIHLHWINNGMIDIKSLQRVNKPLVWTMRDMWPFTGGCHYALNCTRYQQHCGSCPQLNSQRAADLSTYILTRKQRYYPDTLKLVAISNWLADCAASSAVFRKSNIDVIFNAINSSDFYPVDREEARSNLGLPLDTPIVLAGAQYVEHEYKGLKKLLEASRYIRGEPLYVFFGRMGAFALDGIGINYKLIGYIENTESLRLLYSAADVFVAPSLQEAFGKTIIEAMACGTPVVAFNATGPKDIVINQKTGYLAKPFSEEDLANGVNWILENPDRRQLAFDARERVLRSFDIKIIAKQYEALYRRMASKDRPTHL